MVRLEGRVSQLQNSGTSSSNGGNNGPCDGSGNGRKRKCFECGSEDHVVKDCPVRKWKQGTGSQQQSNNRRDVAEWRKKAPGAGESKEKTVDGKICKWCEKCNQGKGSWKIGDKAHTTAEHRTNRECRAMKCQQQGNLAGASLWSF